MEELSIEEVVSLFLGKPLRENARKCARSYGMPYRAYISTYGDFRKSAERFGIPEKLAENWLRNNIRLYVDVIEEDDAISDIRITKYKETGDWARPAPVALPLTSEELRIVRDVLEDLTGPDYEVF